MLPSPHSAVKFKQQKKFCQIFVQIIIDKWLRAKFELHKTCVKIICQAVYKSLVKLWLKETSGRGCRVKRPFYAMWYLLRLTGKGHFYGHFMPCDACKVWFGGGGGCLLAILCHVMTVKMTYLLHRALFCWCRNA